MKDKDDTLGGVKREEAMLASGFCLGLSHRDEFPLEEFDRKMLRIAAKALHAACLEKWPEWFKK